MIFNQFKNYSVLNASTDIIIIFQTFELGFDGNNGLYVTQSTGSDKMIGMSSQKNQISGTEARLVAWNQFALSSGSTAYLGDSQLQDSHTQIHQTSGSADPETLYITFTGDLIISDVYSIYAYFIIFGDNTTLKINYNLSIFSDP